MCRPEKTTLRLVQLVPDTPPFRYSIIMSDHGDIEVEAAPVAFPALPKDVASEIGQIKLFNKWSYDDIEVRDVSLVYV